MGQIIRREDALAGNAPHDVLPLRLPCRIFTYAWGAKYIDELLSLTLPALLAPGNLPYVASMLECDVVILSEEGAFPKILSDPAVRRIRDLCPLRLIGLDDLIPAPDKYGMALTYVLHRGLSDLGPAMTDHWFLFLNADFILADGSLRNLVKHLAAGKRFVVSPSYCVNAEAVRPGLHARVDPQTRQLSLAPRDMARLVLEHRHNTIRGKTVNQQAFSARHMDQFYWLVDDSTLIGHQMPIAVVGMRPERHVAQPNSYWDHGLMGEFFPTVQPFVMGDSDEFLMLELRDEQVSLGELRAGWPTPQEIARNTIWFLTAYQKDMVKYPLTLRAGELPASTDAARAQLQTFVSSVMAHVPETLPSHIDHPQWHFHWQGFTEARHKYLSVRLDSVTETSAPPDSLSAIDTLWWKLDGLTNAARRRGELVNLMERQRGAVNAMLAKIDDLRWSDIGERLTRDLDVIAPERIAQKASAVGHGAVQWHPDQEEPPLWTHPVSRILGCPDRGECGGVDVDGTARQDKKRILIKALEFVERRCRTRPARGCGVRSRAQPLQRDYDRVLNRESSPAAVPHVVETHGPQTATADVGGNLLLRVARRVYRAGYGRLPHVRLLHPYWSAMRHLIRAVNDATRSGASNVLVVVGSDPMADTIADHLTGVHAQVSLLEVIGGNLDKAFKGHPQFDLCICSMGAADLSQFAKVIRSVTPCMRKGGKVIGFHPNFDLDQNSIHTLNVPARLFDDPASGRIYYAGSESSAGVIRRARRFNLAPTAGRFSAVARTATRLFSITPRALTANLLEAASSKEEGSRFSEHCTSITIEVTA